MRYGAIFCSDDYRGLNNFIKICSELVNHKINELWLIFQMVQLKFSSVIGVKITWSIIR